MALHICCDCGDDFERDAAWKVRCISCWRKNKDAAEFSKGPAPRQSAYTQPDQRRPRPKAQSQTQTQTHQKVNPRPASESRAHSAAPQPSNTAVYQKEIAKLKQEVESLRMLLLLEKNKNRPTVNTGSGGGTSIPEDMLGRLIRLAHPDRHGNSEASNKATAWLLDQRKATRR